MLEHSNLSPYQQGTFIYGQQSNEMQSGNWLTTVKKRLCQTL